MTGEGVRFECFLAALTVDISKTHNLHVGFSASLQLHRSAGSWVACCRQHKRCRSVFSALVVFDDGRGTAFGNTRIFMAAETVLWAAGGVVVHGRGEGLGLGAKQATTSQR